MADAAIFSTAISTSAMSFITSASTWGTLLDIRYFIPMYDYRLDPTIATNKVSAFSAVAEEVKSLINPIGEKLYYTNVGYDLNNHMILSAGWVSPDHAFQNQMNVGMNTFNGVPLQNAISGTAFEYDGNGQWTITGETTATGDNTPPTGTISDYFKMGDYRATYETSGGGALVGTFTGVLNQNIGRYKFNKIALYAIARFGDGTEYPVSSPFYFGEIYLQSPYTNLLTNNMGEITFECQFKFMTVTSAFQNVFYSTSGDYWIRSIGGVHYPYQVAIGDMLDSQFPPLGAVHIRRTRTTSGSSANLRRDIPQLRIDDNVNQWFSLEQTPTVYGTAPNAIGEIIWKANNYCNNRGSMDVNLTPQVSGVNGWGSKRMNLGTQTYPFGKMYLSASDDAVITVNTDQIYIGNLPDGMNPTIRNAITISDKGISIIYPNGSSISGKYDGGDLTRHSTSLLIYSYYTTATDVENKNIYLLAGVNADYNYISVDGQTGLTHKNLENTLAAETWAALNLSATVNIVGLGGVKVYGPLELDRLDPAGLTNAYGVVRTKDRDMVIINGMETTATYDDIQDILITNQDNTTPTRFTNLLKPNSPDTLWLISPNIKVDGDVTPVESDTLFLGNNDKKFYGGYFDRLWLGNTQTTPQTGLQIGNIDAAGTNGITYGIIKLGLAAGDTVAQIGQNTDPIDYGYFRNLTVNTSFTAPYIDTSILNVTDLYASNLISANQFYIGSHKLGQFNQLNIDSYLINNDTPVASTTTTRYIIKNAGIGNNLTFLNTSLSNPIQYAVIGNTTLMNIYVSGYGTNFGNLAHILSDTVPHYLSFPNTVDNSLRLHDSNVKIGSGWIYLNDAYEQRFTGNIDLFYYREKIILIKLAEPDNRRDYIIKSNDGSSNFVMTANIQFNNLL